jgi:hypothetical protein
MLRIATIVTIMAALWGCTNLQCGDGTHEENGLCVANIPYSCGPGTVFVKGHCFLDGYDAQGADATDTDEDRDGED